MITAIVGTRTVVSSESLSPVPLLKVTPDVLTSVVPEITSRLTVTVTIRSMGVLPLEIVATVHETTLVPDITPPLSLAPTKVTLLSNALVIITPAASTALGLVIVMV